MKPCTTCRQPVDPLAVFPGGVCLTCWEKSAPPMPTAEELVAMWGGPVKKKVL